jgi:hypothetical protein
VVLDDHIEASLSSGYMRRSTTEHYFRVLDLDCGHSKENSWGSETFRDPS